MKSSAVLAAAMVLGGALATAAIAQEAPPQIPTPANPFPANPVTTDGISLLPGHARKVVTRSGRYADPVEGFFGLVQRGY